MSVQCNTYVLRGAVLPYSLFKAEAGDDDDVHDRLEPYMDNAFEGIHHHEGLCVLFDGMSSKYVAIGYVRAKTKNHAGFEEPVAIPPPDAMGDALLKAAIEKLAGSAVVIGDHVISHYR